MRSRVCLRGEGWAWLSDSPPAWQYGPNRWPALTREEKRAAEHGGRRAMVAEAIAGGGQRAEQFRAGMVNGVHYLELVEPIKQLKREGPRRGSRTLLCGDRWCRRGCAGLRTRAVLHRASSDRVAEARPQRRGDRCPAPVSYTHLRAHETRHDLVCRLLLEKKK